MSTFDPSKTVYRVADLSPTRITRFTLTPPAEQLADIATKLDLSALRKVRFDGEIAAQGPSDWRLAGRLGATVVQPCVVTLDPVTTRIEEPVSRLYLAEGEVPDGVEMEMPEDDSIEPLPDQIDLMAVLIEALALNIPPYPRAKDASPDRTVFTEPGKDPLRDEDMRPFAGLAALRDTMSEPDE